MKITKMQSGNVIATVIKAVLTIIIVLFVEGFLWFVFLFLVYEIVTLIINLLFGRYLRFTLASTNRGLMKAYVKFGTLYLINSIMGIIYTNVGPILLIDVLGKDALDNLSLPNEEKASVIEMFNAIDEQYP
jgi:O-antigen/teichoic acid export membrane protein